MSDAPAVVPFEPAKYLTKISGAEYLEVKWRLVWLRDLHPDAAVETECLYADDKMARFICRISVPGHGSATGHGSETQGDFRDFYEKAETKAIGRACAALGFGTQFCDDHDFGAGAGRVVDSPARVVARRDKAPPAEHTGHAAPAAKTAAEPLVTAAHVARLHAVGKAVCNLDHEGLTAQAYARYKVVHLADLTQRQFGDFIKRIEREDLVDGELPPGRVDPIEDNETNAREFRP
jgi:hypothetical protein